MISVTLTKAKRVFRDRRVLKAARGQFFGVVGAYRRLGQERKSKSNEELLDYSSSLGGGVIRAAQIRSEILGLLDEVRKLKPRRMLEVGTANGGTLFLLSQVAHSEASIVSVDLPGGRFGEGYAWWRVPLYRRFARDKQTIQLLRGDSHSLEMLDRVRKTLGNQPLDFAFIDGDHSYDGVKQDFEFYGRLVRKGGLVAFHDIAESTDPAIQVDRFWKEVKQEYRHVELISDLNQRGYGIGLLYVD
jgi:predicted O-methyltransferase YrrM